MKSQLLSVRNVHHIEESQLEQMLTRHDSRVHDHVSFLVSPPCFSTNFMSMTNFELASTADEAQGSTSRTVAGEKVTCGNTEGRVGEWNLAPTPSEAESEQDTPHSQSNRSENQASPAGNDFSILHRPHIVRKKEEVHVELCHKCERMASGHCECGLAVCTAHRYSSDGERNPYGMCGKCQKEITGDVEVFSNGRQV